jgi:hypothetical protein
MLYQVVLRRKLLLLATLLGIVASNTHSSPAAEVTLAWNASPDAEVTGYRVYIGGASGNYTNSAAVGNVTNATIANLIPGGSYFFAATAYNALGDESDFSNEANYTVPLPANQAPTLNTIANVTVNEGAGLQTVNLAGIGSGAANETQTLTVTASSSNPALIPNPAVTYTSPNAIGSLRFTPVALAFGTATISVTVNDGATSNNIVTRTFTVTVSPVNQAPTLNTIANVTVNEGAGLQTVNLAGIGSGAANETQTLTVIATSSNPALIPNPAVTYTSPNATGSLSFTPVALASGTATISVAVDDGATSNNIVTRTFTVTVNSVNQAPTLNTIADVTVNENAGLQTVNLAGISTGATNETQTLTVTATSSNPTLIPNPTVTYASPAATGTLRFTPAANAGGTATITVTVNDGGSTPNTVTRTFTVTVNRLPIIAAITNQVVSLNSNTPAIAFTISDPETAAGSLTLSASSSDVTLVPLSGITFGGSGGNRTVRLTPAANQSGTADITITVNDGSATAARTFELQVLPKPTPPGSLRIVQALP